jgi:hypothetical protein
MAVFSLVTPCSFVRGSQTLMMYHHIWYIGHLLLEDGGTGCSETLATTYYTTVFRKPDRVNLTVTCSLFLH